MKRFIALLFSLLIVLISVVSAFASESVSFSLGDVECDTNRLFYVEVRAKSAYAISAATFEFTYDKTMLEFRGVSTDDDSLVKANELENSVMAVYLCSDGKNIENETTLFKIQFKSIGSGSSYINYTVSDCVDSNVESMPVGNCSAALVTVKASASSESSSGTASKISSESSTKSDEKYSGKTSESAENTSLSTYDEFGFLNDNIADNSNHMFIVGIICGIVLVALLIAAFFAGRHMAGKKDNQNPYQ